MLSRCSPRVAIGRENINSVYAITPDGVADDDRLLQMVAQAAAGGVRWFQYRNPSGSAAVRRRQAASLAAFCRAQQCRLIINDDPALAKAVSADGVHLGLTDPPLADARRVLGAHTVIGMTCHAEVARAERLATAGADYVAFGAIFVSATKPQAARCSLSVLSQAARRLRVPVVAVGGITPDNVGEVAKAGASAAAVCQGLFAADDITQTARTLQAAFTKN